VALTAPHMQKLQRAGLVKFLDEHPDAYRAMAKVAFDSTKTILTPSKQKVRPDDLYDLVLVGIELDEALAVFCAKQGVRAAYWMKWFTDLVIDTFWEELNK
jgi:hypothetical protein